MSNTDETQTPQTPQTPESSQAQHLETRNRELETTLADVRAELERSERRRVIDRCLRDAGSLDIETGALLAERLIEAQPDADAKGIEGAIDELRRDKPYLFRSVETPSVSGSSRTAEQDDRALRDAARDAALRGDAGSVMRYMRARRDNV